MLAPSPGIAAGATDAIARTGSEAFVTAQMDSAPDFWLRDACRHILGKDAGLHLHFITGYPERTCYRYASGEREPPCDFLRKLFRSAQGEPFFLAFMDRCQQQWWRDFQRERDFGQRVIEMAERI